MLVILYHSGGRVYAADVNYKWICAASEEVVLSQLRGRGSNNLHVVDSK